MNLFNKISDFLLFPDADRCCICSKECSKNICSECQDVLAALFIKDNSACYSYSGIVREIIHRYKFSGQKYLCATISQLMFEKAKDIDAEIITNVPIHKKRLSQRGYDQSKLLAQSLSERTGYTYMPLLKKDKDTVAQSTLKMEERIKNVEGAYTANDFDISNKKILLIDDIITTGSTIKECMNVLIKKGAAKVYPLSFAKTDGDK